jgi:hypothetical protein
VGGFWLEVGGRGKMEERGRGDEEGEKILGNEKCSKRYVASVFYFLFFFKKKSN